MLRISVREPSLDHLMFGGSTIGCLFKEVSENQAENALKAALNHGIRKFDTAPLYGSGLSELRYTVFYIKNHFQYHYSLVFGGILLLKGKCNHLWWLDVIIIIIIVIIHSMIIKNYVLSWTWCHEC